MGSVVPYIKLVSEKLENISIKITEVGKFIELFSKISLLNQAQSYQTKLSPYLEYTEFYILFRQ